MNPLLLTLLSILASQQSSAPCVQRVVHGTDGKPAAVFVCKLDEALPPAPAVVPDALKSLVDGGASPSVPQQQSEPADPLAGRPKPSYLVPDANGWLHIRYAQPIWVPGVAEVTQ